MDQDNSYPDIQHTLSLLEKLSSKVKLPWYAHANVPFYVQIKKPRPSLSKHDSQPTYWHYDDGEYLVTCVNLMPQILEYIRELEKEKAKCV